VRVEPPCEVADHIDLAPLQRVEDRHQHPPRAQPQPAKPGARLRNGTSPPGEPQGHWRREHDTSRGDAPQPAVPHRTEPLSPTCPPVTVRITLLARPRKKLDLAVTSG
jgi:hypothetical protein